MAIAVAYWQRQTTHPFAPPLGMPTHHSATPLLCRAPITYMDTCGCGSSSDVYCYTAMGRGVCKRTLRSSAHTRPLGSANEPQGFVRVYEWARCKCEHGAYEFEQTVGVTNEQWHVRMGGAAGCNELKVIWIGERVWTAERANVAMGTQGEGKGIHTW